MKSKFDKRNYIIIGLCAILVVMGVGYAAFSSLLTINGTANISNSWCLGFDNTKTNTYQITKGVSTGQAPTGTMTYTGTACSTTLVPHSNLTAAFHQPGDQIEYTLTIKNASTVTAAIKSIKVDNQTITGNTTKTKGNITFTVNFPLDTTLSPNEETTMTVIAKFQNETDVTGSYAGSESQSISVELNGEQDDGSGGIVPTPSDEAIYAWNTNTLIIGTSTINDIESTKTAQPYYTSAADVMNASGYTFFNKYTVEDDVITEGYTCQTFGILGFEPICVKYNNYGNDGTGNKGLLKSLDINTTFTGNNPAGTCNFSDSNSSVCTAGNLSVTATIDGNVYSGDSNTHAGCNIYDYYGTRAFCYE